MVAESKLRKQIADTCLQLEEQGLLLRSWGSVSARLNDQEMIITPTGVAYKDLTPDKMVKVNVHTLSFSGSRRPSSEVQIHASIYRERTGVGVIVHSHQVYSSCVSAIAQKYLLFMNDGNKTKIPVVQYAFPGSADVSEQVVFCLKKHPAAHSLLLANHGVVCFAETFAAVMQQAKQLEIISYNYLIDVCNTELKYGIVEGFSSFRKEGKIYYIRKDTPERLRQIHKRIYRKRSDVSYILHNQAEADEIISRRYTSVRPLLLDSAQICGSLIRIPANESGKGRETLSIKKNVDVVFSPNDGVFCLGGSRSEAEARALIMNKGCIAQIAAIRRGHANYLSTSDCRKVNRYYHHVYAGLSRGEPEL